MPLLQMLLCSWKLFTAVRVIAFWNFLCVWKAASMLTRVWNHHTAGSKCGFVPEIQLPKTESSYTEKKNVVSKLVLWNVVSQFLFDALEKSHSHDPFALTGPCWGELTHSLMNCRGINPPTSFMLLLFLIISSTYYNKDKGQDCTMGSGWRGEQEWVLNSSAQGITA